MPGPLFAVTVAKSYKSQFAGAQIAAGHALVEMGYVTWSGSRLCPFWSIEPARSGEESFKGGCLLPAVYYLSGLGFGF
jgi:hypothetical protein